MSKEGLGGGRRRRTERGRNTYLQDTHTVPELTETGETLISLGRRGTLVGWPVRAGGQDQSKRTEGWCGTNPGGHPCSLRRVLISPAVRMTLESQEKLSEMVSGHVLHVLACNGRLLLDTRMRSSAMLQTRHIPTCAGGGRGR